VVVPVIYTYLDDLAGWAMNAWAKRFGKIAPSPGATP
jgi:hypothetical protein